MKRDKKETIEFQEYRVVFVHPGTGEEKVVSALNTVFLHNYMRGFKGPFQIEQLCQDVVGKQVLQIYWKVLPSEQGLCFRSPLMNTAKKTRNYMGHTITSCGLSWYIDRTPGKADGVFAETLAEAKAKITLAKSQNAF